MILWLAFLVAIITGVLNAFIEMNDIHAGRKPGVKESDNMLDFILNGNKTK